MKRKELIEEREIEHLGCKHSIFSDANFYKDQRVELLVFTSPMMGYEHVTGFVVEPLVVDGRDRYLRIKIEESFSRAKDGKRMMTRNLPYGRIFQAWEIEN